METASVTTHGRHTRISYKGVSVDTTMSLSDALEWAIGFTNKVDTLDRRQLRDWLGGHSAVLASSRDALVDDNTPATPRDFAHQSAVEHTDPAWRHLGVDETAGDPDLREFTKTDTGFIRKDPAEKSPALPAEGDALEEKKEAKKGDEHSHPHFGTPNPTPAPAPAPAPAPVHADPAAPPASLAERPPDT